MIMNGSQPIHTRQNGKMFLKIIATILVLSCILSGCSLEWWLGDGRGDWTMELFSGYSISRINGHQIVLGYKKSPEDVVYTTVIANYYVAAYQLHEPYICLEGIQTRSFSASDEELTTKDPSYYLINTVNGDIIGPFEYLSAFSDHCALVGVDITEEWTQTKTGDGSKPLKK